MKIIQTTGCTAYDLTFDGVSEVDLTPERREEIINYLLHRAKEELAANSIQLERLVEIFQYDEFDSDEHACDQCGDTVHTTTWEI